MSHQYVRYTYTHKNKTVVIKHTVEISVGQRIGSLPAIGRYKHNDTTQRQTIENNIDEEPNNTYPSGGVGMRTRHIGRCAQRGAHEMRASATYTIEERGES